jgi:sortase B
MADKLQEILDEIDEKKTTEDERPSVEVREKPAAYERAPKAKSKEAKQNIFVSAGRAVVPLKGDKPLEIVRKCVFIVSFAVAITCLVWILQDMNASRANENLNSGILEMVEQSRLTGRPSIPPEEARQIEEAVPGIMPEYIDIYSQNNDVIGWVNVPGTKINYPVLQRRWTNEDGSIGGSNQYYLDHDFNNRPSKHGTIFAEWRFPFTPTSRPDNSVLYGHNIHDGSMFANAARYYPYYNMSRAYANANFYKTNPLIYFDTLYETGVYKVFAAMYVHTEEDKYDDVFDYFRWREFPDRDTFYAFIVNVLDRSGIYTDVDIEYGDEILTLSTCYYPLGEHIDSRVAVFARRVRPGESLDVNTDAAYHNTSPLYFDLYYRSMGGSWDGRTWDTSKVKGLDEWLAERGGEEIPRLFRNAVSEG